MSTTMSTSKYRANTMIELPDQQPCEFCEGFAGRDPTWAVIDECATTVTVINPYQYEVGQCRRVSS